MRRKTSLDRISQAEALQRLKPIMSKSSFYGTVGKPGPRWTEIDRLDIREGPPVTLDRARFEKWFETLMGAPAMSRSNCYRRFGANSEMEAGPRATYGSQLVELLRALQAGIIDRDQFDQAAADLKNQPVSGSDSTDSSEFLPAERCHSHPPVRSRKPIRFSVRSACA